MLHHKNFKALPWAKKEAEKSSTSAAALSSSAKLIEARSLEIQQLFNERQYEEAYKYAAPDFTYRQDRQDGSVTLNAQEACVWMRDVIYKDVVQMPEVLNTSIEIDEKRGFGTVWMSIRIFDLPYNPVQGSYQVHETENGRRVPAACLYPGVEKISVYRWERNALDWQWIHHLCLPPVPPLPS